MNPAKSVKDRIVFPRSYALRGNAHRGASVPQARRRSRVLYWLVFYVCFRLLSGTGFKTDGLLVAAFMHPLSSLQADDLRSALHQVVKLAENFGTSYASEGLSFGTT
jgi:hypothetical protein